MPMDKRAAGVLALPNFETPACATMRYRPLHNPAGQTAATDEDESWS